LDEQVQYYRARAPEYDETSYGVVTGERASVPAIVDRFNISGDVLEIACGTGIWTAELVRYGDSLTVLDSSPEVLTIAADRLSGNDVTFVEANIFEWTPDATYDVVFFAAWLSHVPSDRFDSFWETVGKALRPGGRVLILDEGPDRAHLEQHQDGEVARRALADGSEYDIVKVFYSADELTDRLTALGWTATVTPSDHHWFVAEVRRST
jgi:demethylmenaquinone methyltransferase/2-methoxy-6-polyprenyl-1,4-benzoquinol methylase